MLSIFDSNIQKTPLEISVVFDRWGRCTVVKSAPIVKRSWNQEKYTLPWPCLNQLFYSHCGWDAAEKISRNCSSISDTFHNRAVDMLDICCWSTIDRICPSRMLLGALFINSKFALDDCLEKCAKFPLKILPRAS
jgi:hypothetical protein